MMPWHERGILRGAQSKPYSVLFLYYRLGAQKTALYKYRTSIPCACESRNMDGRQGASGPRVTYRLESLQFL